MADSRMKDADLSLLERIDLAMDRITSYQAAMRIPVEATDPDVVLADCKDCIAALEAQAQELKEENASLRTRIEQFQFCINTVAAELGVCCGGVDSTPQEQLDDRHSTTRVLLAAIKQLRKTAVHYG